MKTTIVNVKVVNVKMVTLYIHNEGRVLIWDDVKNCLHGIRLSTLAYGSFLQSKYSIQKNSVRDAEPHITIDSMSEA